MWNTWQAHGGPATKQASVQNSMPLIVTVLCATSRRLNEVGSTGWGALALLREQLGGAGAGCGDDRIGDRFVNGDAGDDYVARLEWVGGSVVAKTGLLDCYWEGLAGAADSFERCDAFYKNSRIKQYLKDGRALRIETVINSPDDLRCHRRLVHLDELQARARAVNTTLLDTERVGQGCVLASPAVERIARPTLTEEGRRAPALRFGDPRVQALAGALCTTMLAVTGITNKSLRALMTGLRRQRLHHQPGQLRPGPAAPQRPHHPHPSQEPLPAHRRRAAVRDLLHQTARPAAAPTAGHRPTTSATAGTKSLEYHRDSHHREPRPGSHTAKGSLKLRTTLNDLATKDRYAAAGTAPGSGGPSGSFTSRGRVVS
jgi:hypothetical protein